jgi:hypothetical protein
MESLKTNLIEKDKGRELFKRFFNRHVVAALLSLASFQAIEKPAEAQETKVPGIEQTDSKALEKSRRQALEDFKLLVDKGNIDQIISKQMERFGMAAGSFFINRRVALDVRQMKDLYAKKDDSNMFVAKEGIQFATAGSLVESAYRERWVRQRAEQRQTQLKNIENIPGLSAEELRDFLKKYYPSNYIESCIASIEFVNQSDVRKEENVEVLGQVQAFGISTMFGSKDGDLRAPIRVNLPAGGITKEFFYDVLKHEISHAFDPLNNSVLTSGERVQMLEDIYLRSISSDRYISEYVESITIKEIGVYLSGRSITNPTEQNQYLAFIKTTEYWAEIHKAYFENKEQFQKEHPADYAVVHKWVEAMSK